MPRPRLSVSGLMLLVLALGVGFIALRLASRAWAGLMLFLTLGVLLTAIVGAIYRDGPRRAFWLGFALFGWAYMIVTARIWLDHEGPELITSLFFMRQEPQYQIDTLPSGFGGKGLHHPTVTAPRVVASPITQLLTGYDARDQRIAEKLELEIPIHFPDETPLEDVLKYIKQATQAPGDTGIPFYVDPNALITAEKTMQSPVTLDLDRVRVKTGLRLLLRQQDLTYIVRDGLLIVTSPSLPDDEFDTFGRIAHCLAAIVTATIGGMIARVFQSTRDRASARQDDHTTAPVQLDPAPAVQP